MCGRWRADAAGNGYVGMGGTCAGSAAVMQVAPDGKATKVFEGKELGVQAVRVAADGVCWWRLLRMGRCTGFRRAASDGSAAVVFDPAQTEEKPKYIWDVGGG